MSIEHIKNLIRIEAHRVISIFAKPRWGIVNAYDPAHHSVRVEIQPSGKITGWMPLGSIWIGNGWGCYATPNLGDKIDIHYQQDDPNAPYACMRFFSGIQPLAVQSGEFWLVHQSGASLKLTNDGKASLNSTTEVDIGNLATTLHKLVTDAFQALFNGHTHSGGAVPDQMMTNAHLTSVVKAN